MALARLVSSTVRQRRQRSRPPGGHRHDPVQQVAGRAGDQLGRGLGHARGSRADSGAAKAESGRPAVRGAVGTRRGGGALGPAVLFPTRGARPWWTSRRTIGAGSGPRALPSPSCSIRTSSRPASSRRGHGAAKALADREADRSRTVPPVQPAPAARPDAAWPRPEQGLVFLAGLAVGIGAVAAGHMLRPAPAPAPHVATVLSVPAWPRPPAVIAAMPGRGADPLPAGLPMLVAPLLEPGVGAPEPAFAVAAVVSKAREASVAAGLPQLRLAEAPPGSSIARPRLGVPASADGPDPGVAAFDPAPVSMPDPDARPTVPRGERPGADRPDRPPKTDVPGTGPERPPAKPPKPVAADAQATDAAQASDADAAPAGSPASKGRRPNRGRECLRAPTTATGRRITPRPGATTTATAAEAGATAQVGGVAARATAGRAGDNGNSGKGGGSGNSGKGGGGNDRR